MMHQGPTMAAPHHQQQPPPPMTSYQLPHQLYQQQQQQYQQYQQQYPQPPSSSSMSATTAPQSSGSDESRTLWIGDLQYWMDESYISACFAQSGEVISVKVIRNRQTMQSECYGFVEFTSHEAADRALQAYNNTMMPNVEQTFKLNWAFYGSGEKRGDDSSDFAIFVGDLAADVNDSVLQAIFSAHYASVKGAKVVMDRLSGRSKGYGFVHFSDENEHARAMSEMNGIVCSGRPMRIGAAANKKNIGATATYQNNTQGTQNESDPNNTTVFVGNLDSNVTEEILRQTFTPYGDLVHVKIPMGKQCGFVQFTNRSSAEEAIRALNGSQLGGRNVRLSWGRSPNKQSNSTSDQNQWNNGNGNVNGAYYGYQQGYNSYGYVSAPQDPNMYYGGYPGYGGYAMPQQSQQPLQQHQ